MLQEVSCHTSPAIQVQFRVLMNERIGYRKITVGNEINEIAFRGGLDSMSHMASYAVRKYGKYGVPSACSHPFI